MGHSGEKRNNANKFKPKRRVNCKSCVRCLVSYVNFSSHQKWTKEVTSSRHTYDNTHSTDNQIRKKKLSFSRKTSCRSLRSRQIKYPKHLSSLLEMLVRFPVPMAFFSLCDEICYCADPPNRRALLHVQRVQTSARMRRAAL